MFYTTQIESGICKPCLVLALLATSSLLHAEVIVLPSSSDWNDEMTYSEQQNYLYEMENGGIPQLPNETYSDAYNRAYELENNPEQYIQDMYNGL